MIASLKDSLLRVTSSALYIQHHTVSILLHLRRTHTRPAVRYRAQALMHLLPRPPLAFGPIVPEQSCLLYIRRHVGTRHTHRLISS